MHKRDNSMLRDRKLTSPPRQHPQDSRRSKPSSSQRQQGKQLVVSAARFAAAAAAAVAVLLLIALRWRLATESDAAGCCAAATSADGARMQRLPYTGGLGEVSNRYTLLLNSFRRRDLLTASIAHYARCPQLDSIRVVWCEDKVGPPSPQQDSTYYSNETEVRYDLQPSASLNNRFRPPPGLRTIAVLSIDDDILVPCDQVAATFAVWQQNTGQLVGWFPRGHVAALRPAKASARRVANQREASGSALEGSRNSAGGKSGDGVAQPRPPPCTYHYLLRDSAVLLRRSYSIILTKGAFLHRDWLRTYTEFMPPMVLSYIDETRNCEDIAMAFLVANATGQAPVYHRAKGLKDVGQGVRKVKGISSLGGHAEERSACVNEFVRLMGGMPLVTRSLSEHRNSWGLQLATLWDRAI